MEDRRRVDRHGGMMEGDCWKKGGRVDRHGGMMEGDCWKRERRES